MTAGYGYFVYDENARSIPHKEKKQSTLPSLFSVAMYVSDIIPDIKDIKFENLKYDAIFLFYP